MLFNVGITGLVSLVNVTFVLEEACLTRLVVVVLVSFAAALFCAVSASAVVSVSVVDTEDPPPEPPIPPPDALSTQTATKVKSPEEPARITISSTGTVMLKAAQVQPTNV